MRFFMSWYVLSSSAVEYVSFTFPLSSCSSVIIARCWGAGDELPTTVEVDICSPSLLLAFPCRFQLSLLNLDSAEETGESILGGGVLSSVSVSHSSSLVVPYCKNNPVEM